MLSYTCSKAACDPAETNCSIGANAWLLVICSFSQILEQVAIDGPI